MIEHVIVRQVALPLSTPYKVSQGTMYELNPFIVEVHDSEGRAGFGEALIAPGYTSETVEGSWQLCCELAKAIAGRSPDEAKEIAQKAIPRGVGASSAVLAALDMVSNHYLLSPKRDLTVPLLSPLQADEPTALADEIEGKLGEGFRTFKVKVGFDWRDDLRHVQTIQSLVGERATLRLDANQGYKTADGMEFAKRLDPRGIELFEQPCHMDDWKANAEVAGVSSVPVMLDESIYDVSDIDRAASIKGVGFVKLKLKKIGGVDMLVAALEKIRENGLTPVLGDGVSLEIGCWTEACVAAHSIDNAGEMNGFLKTKSKIFKNPWQFENGSIHIPAGYSPDICQEELDLCTRRLQAYNASKLPHK